MDWLLTLTRKRVPFCILICIQKMKDVDYKHYSLYGKAFEQILSFSYRNIGVLIF